CVGDVCAVDGRVYPDGFWGVLHGNGGAHDGIGQRVDHRHVVVEVVGDVGAVDGRVHPHGLWAMPYEDGIAHDGVGRRVDHRHVVGEIVGDVGAPMHHRCGRRG